jgi:dihydroxyacetone kinase
VPHHSEFFFFLFFQVSKIIGVASEADWSFDAVLKLGQAVTGAIASIVCTLDHCHVPGRSEYSVIPPKTVEIGLGLHNEPVSNHFDHVG